MTLRIQCRVSEKYVKKSVNKDVSLSVMSNMNSVIKMTRAWEKEKSESPTEMELMTTRTLGGRSIH